MKTQYTPGPWAVETMTRPYGDCGETYNSLCVTHKTEFRSKLICELGADTLPEHPQNAHLIAAAPDLLEALEFLLADWIAIGGSKLTGSNVPAEKAIAAITKATK